MAPGSGRVNKDWWALEGSRRNLGCSLLSLSFSLLRHRGGPAHLILSTARAKQSAIA